MFEKFIGKESRSAMTQIGGWTLALSLLFGSLEPLLAEGAVQEPLAYFLCRNKASVRTIRIQEDTERRCTTTYTKAGVDYEVGSAKNGESCMKFLNNIKDNLEAAAWKCRQASSVKIAKPEGH